MQTFNNHVAGLAIELYANYNIHKMAEAHRNNKATISQLTKAISEHVYPFSIYAVSNLGNYSTKQLYAALAKAIMAAAKQPAGYYAHEAIFNYTNTLSIKPLLNVALYALEAYLTRYQNLTREQIVSLFESGKFTMLSKAVYLAQFENIERFAKLNKVHCCPKCLTCFIYEQCQALPNLKEVKQYLKATGLFNNFVAIN